MKWLKWNKKKIPVEAVAGSIGVPNWHSEMLVDLLHPYEWMLIVVHADALHNIHYMSIYFYLLFFAVTLSLSLSLPLYLSSVCRYPSLFFSIYLGASLNLLNLCVIMNTTPNYWDFHRIFLWSGTFIIFSVGVRLLCWRYLFFCACVFFFYFTLLFPVDVELFVTYKTVSLATIKMLWLLWSFVEHCSLSFFNVVRLILYCCSILYFVQSGEYFCFLRFLMINKNSNVSKSLIHSIINTHVCCTYGFIFAICVSYFVRVFNFEWFFCSFSLNIISLLLLFLLSIVFIFILWRVWRDVISSVTVLELASSPTLWVRDNERLSPSEIQWETYTQF